MAQTVVRPPKADEALKTLDRTHPRLMLKEAGLSELKKRIGTDALLKASVDALLRDADDLCRKPPLVYKKIGPRLLQVSRDCVHRMYTLGLACAVVDLTPAYRDAAKSAKRGVAMIDRRSVLIEDELELTTPCGVAWGMTTGAEIVLEGNRGVLREGGKEMDVAILSPEGATFSVESAERRPPERENKDIRRLMIRLGNRQGSVRIVVWMGPRAGAEPPQRPVVKPLVEW